MALFKADEILRDSTEEEVIECDFFIIPEDVEVPTITIEVNNKVREIARASADKNCGDLRIRYAGGGKRPEGIITDDRQEYCHDVLNAAFVNCSGLIDSPSKKAILALLIKEPQFTKKLAAKLIEYFEHNDLYADEEADRKN